MEWEKLVERFAEDQVVGDLCRQADAGLNSELDEDGAPQRRDSSFRHRAHATCINFSDWMRAPFRPSGMEASTTLTMSSHGRQYGANHGCFILE